MQFMKKICITTLILILFSFKSLATYLNIEKEQKGSYFGDGYTFNIKDSTWTQSLPPKTHPALKAIYRSPSGKSSLTIRESELAQKTKLKKYVKSWIKDYRKYGLNLIDSKPLKINEQKAFMIDSEHIVTKKVFRQIVLLKDKKSITITCKTEKDSNELVKCAELIKNFSWNKQETAL